MSFRLTDALLLSRAGALFKETAQSLLDAFIDDGAASPGRIWSSQRTGQEITARLATALEGEDLSDLADRVTANAQADAGFVSFSAPQSLTEEQKQQFRDNIGVDTAGTGGPAHDAVTTAGGATTNPIQVDANQVLTFNIEALASAP